MKYKEWLNTWLNFYVKPTVKMQTYVRYEHIAKKHIASGLGGYNLEELSALVLQSFVVRLSEEKHFWNLLTIYI